MVESPNAVNSLDYSDTMAYFPFAQLPPELRIMIYRVIFAGRIKHIRYLKPNIPTQKDLPVALLSVSRQIYCEARPIFFATAQPHIEIGDEWYNAILPRAQKYLRYKAGPNRTRDLSDQQVLASHMSFRSVHFTTVGGTQCDSKGVEFSVRFAAHLLKIFEIFRLRLQGCHDLPLLHLDLSQLTSKNPEISIQQAMQTLLRTSAMLLRFTCLAAAGHQYHARVLLTPPALSALVNDRFSDFTGVVTLVHRFWVTVLNEVVHPKTGQILPPEMYYEKVGLAAEEFSRMSRARCYIA